ncbi:peptide methionine sulfoxide reductase MsrA (S-form specific) [Natronomonas moolapensis 8.8.11]|jgi:peptide-methionine (S)-S-oxide reductase|uniref:peptide-methionine (S)-S-oxide reductase n=1 Tax=Natronomonas moolapensis (strain DSM 18674 / CECT 7526 / JCM 14361 / 8.8.11) TaxID=268739 RepID=M1XNX7_NATM8|nr:peptide-methionine (S)-S-oxide reductase [Natronomonas moolapensis]CCQ35699.1 peptide methionine sulfoxide reductase MsrA (S-form specific) [Natronomonas moolapensis 8.8.11]
MPSTPRTIVEYDRAAPTREATETATFGLGCFWGPDARFGAMDGVVRTRVGYAGGTESNPTYHALGDHTEVVQVDYDPTRFDYRSLLAAAFAAHDPYRQPTKRQYHHIVFPGTDRQRATLEAYLDREGYDSEDVTTRIEALSAFHPAESYHQKYTLRTDRTLLESFEAAEYDDEAIRESPAAAKLNADRAGREVAPVPELGIGTAPRHGRE